MAQSRCPMGSNLSLLYVARNLLQQRKTVKALIAGLLVLNLASCGEPQGSNNTADRFCPALEFVNEGAVIQPVCQDLAATQRYSIAC